MNSSKAGSEPGLLFQLIPVSVQASLETKLIWLKIAALCEPNVLGAYCTEVGTSCRYAFVTAPLKVERLNLRYVSRLLLVVSSLVSKVAPVPKFVLALVPSFTNASATGLITE